MFVHIYKEVNWRDGFRLLCCGRTPVDVGSDREKYFLLNGTRQASSAKSATCLACLKIYEKQKMKELRLVMDRINYVINNQQH